MHFARRRYRANRNARMMREPPKLLGSTSSRAYLSRLQFSDYNSAAENIAALEKRTGGTAEPGTETFKNWPKQFLRLGTPRSAGASLAFKAGHPSRSIHQAQSDPVTLQPRAAARSKSKGLLFAEAAARRPMPVVRGTVVAGRHSAAAVLRAVPQRRRPTPEGLA